MMRNLSSIIEHSRLLRDAALRFSGNHMSAGDKWMRDGFAAEVDAQFKLLATAMGYLVTRDEQDRSAAE